jgi:hypothetical protein
MVPLDAQSMLLRSVAEASRQVVIFSPALELTIVRKLVEAGLPDPASIFIVTQTPDELRDGAKKHCEAESLLRSAGFHVIHKRKMLDKLAIIDGDDVWTTSFSLLGPTPENGFGIRRKSCKFATEVSDFYYVEKLLEPFREGDHRCPVCDKEMVAADSRQEKPFYWTCVESGCFTRDLDTPAPVDGYVSFRCGSAPEFGYWGETPYWFCTCGQKPAHRTKIHRNHLKLPKMRVLIPARSLGKVCRNLGVDAEAGVQGILSFDS